MIECINEKIAKIGILRHTNSMSFDMSDKNINFHKNEIDELKSLKETLKLFGGEENLKMYLTGAGGTGKSHVIHSSQAFCCEFAAKIGLIFNEKTFLITACTCSAAALLNGFTIHSSAHLNRKKINDEHREYWSDVKILIIDECSFLSMNDLKN